MVAMRGAREEGMHEELRGGGISPAGGRCGLLVVDLDQHPYAAARLSTREAEALRAACARIAALAVMTRGSGVDVRRALAQAGIGVAPDAPRIAVLPDEPRASTSRGAGSTRRVQADGEGDSVNIGATAKADATGDSSRETHPIGAADRAAACVRLCQRLHIPLAATIVIATDEADLAPLLEAGHALALADAGATCCAVADARFPARAAGGLADALDAAARLATRELTR